MRMLIKKLKLKVKKKLEEMINVLVAQEKNINTVVDLYNQKKGL